MKDLINDFKSVDVAWKGYDNFEEEVASLVAVSVDSFPRIPIK